MNSEKRKRYVKDDSEGLNPSSRNFIYDQVDDFNNLSNDDSNSLSEINDDETEEKVWGIGGDSSEDDDGDEEDENSVGDDSDHNELFKNDIESSEESTHEDDERLLGKNKKYYFGTDLTDQRIHKTAQSKSAKKVAALELEQEGAKLYQSRLRKELEVTHNCSPLNLWRKEAYNKQEGVSQIDADSIEVSKAKQKLKKKEQSRELQHFATELEAVSKELESMLLPLMEAKKLGLLLQSPLSDYIQTRYHLCLNYLTILSAYGMLRCSDDNLSSHPAESRLSQYKTLFSELEPCRKKYEPELQQLMTDIKQNKLKQHKKLRSERKTLKILKLQQGIDKDEVEKNNKNKKSKKYKDRMTAESQRVQNNTGSQNMEVEDTAVEDLATEENASVAKDGRRIISQTIAKNKGLVPSRKKEQRNPRVKYKKKYQNKLKRRKGQVREVRKELQRYGGEISGIKANLVKSIRLK